MIKVATFNVNSLRVRLPIVVDWLKQHRPDILAVQETKVQDCEFPAQAFDELGYGYVFRGQKAYNGVAIFSPHAIENTAFGLLDEPVDEPRLVKADVCGISVVNTYIPQGRSPDSRTYRYKLTWFERLRQFFDANFDAANLVIWVGDLNVAPTAMDVYDPGMLLGHVCFNPQVQAALEQVQKWGFVDVFRRHCDQPGQFTFWDYRTRNPFAKNRGWRLDHIMATEPLAAASRQCYIDREPRTATRPSDHTPVVAEFDW